MNTLPLNFQFDQRDPATSLQTGMAPGLQVQSASVEGPFASDLRVAMTLQTNQVEGEGLPLAGDGLPVAETGDLDLSASLEVGLPGLELPEVSGEQVAPELLTAAPMTAADLAALETDSGLPPVSMLMAPTEGEAIITAGPTQSPAQEIQPVLPVQASAGAGNESAAFAAQTALDEIALRQSMTAGAATGATMTADEPAMMPGVEMNSQALAAGTSGAAMNATSLRRTISGIDQRPVAQNDTAELSGMNLLSEDGVVEVSELTQPLAKAAPQNAELTQRSLTRPVPEAALDSGARVIRSVAELSEMAGREASPDFRRDAMSIAAAERAAQADLLVPNADAGADSATELLNAPRTGTAIQAPSGTSLMTLTGSSDAAGRPTLTMNTAMGQPGFESEFASRVRWLVGQDANRAEIKLNPANLGSIEIRISTEEDKASVTIFAQNAATREIIEQSLPRLREALANSGLSLAEGHVSDQQFGHRDGGDRTSGAGNGAWGGEVADHDDESPAMAVNTRAPVGLVDTFI